MDVLERIEKGEVKVLAIQTPTGESIVKSIGSNFMKALKNQNKSDVEELLELAKLGQQIHSEIENCNDRGIISCFVKNCPGRNYCIKYKARSPESLNNEDLYNCGDYEKCKPCEFRNQTVAKCRLNCPLSKKVEK